MSLFNLRIRLKRNLLTSFANLTKEPIQIRNYAARKGYRAKREKAKVKQVEEKKVFIPHNIRNREKMLAARGKRTFDDSWKVGTPIDNVYMHYFFQQKTYPFAEAVQCHRETHHPEIFNQPNEYLWVNIELNMQGEKKTRFIENFVRIAPIPYKFDHGQQRRIVVFGKKPEELQQASYNGAELAGGVELIKRIQNGDLSLQEFDYVLAHTEILPELVQLRGLMKKKFPNPKNGTLGIDLPDMVNRFMNGISYQAKKDEYEKEFGLIETMIGRLNMETEHLEENLKSILKDVWQVKPRREGSFINRVLLVSPPSSEKLKVDYKIYVESEKNENDESDDEIEAKDDARVAFT